MQGGGTHRSETPVNRIDGGRIAPGQLLATTMPFPLAVCCQSWASGVPALCICATSFDTVINPSQLEPVFLWIGTFLLPTLPVVLIQAPTVLCMRAEQLQLYMHARRRL